MFNPPIKTNPNRKWNFVIYCYRTVYLERTAGIFLIGLKKLRTDFVFIRQKHPQQGVYKSQMPEQWNLFVKSVFKNIKTIFVFKVLRISRTSSKYNIELFKLHVVFLLYLTFQQSMCWAYLRTITWDINFTALIEIAGVCYRRTDFRRTLKVYYYSDVYLPTASEDCQPHTCLVWFLYLFYILSVVTKVLKGNMLNTPQKLQQKNDLKIMNCWINCCNTLLKMMIRRIFGVTELTLKCVM